MKQIAGKCPVNARLWSQNINTKYNTNTSTDVLKMIKTVQVLLPGRRTLKYLYFTVFKDKIFIKRVCLKVSDVTAAPDVL